VVKDNKGSRPREKYFEKEVRQDEETIEQKGNGQGGSLLGQHQEGSRGQSS